jgi:hypothetical protein
MLSVRLVEAAGATAAEQLDQVGGRTERIRDRLRGLDRDRGQHDSVALGEQRRTVGEHSTLELGETGERGSVVVGRAATLPAIQGRAAARLRLAQPGFGLGMGEEEWEVAHVNQTVGEGET